MFNQMYVKTYAGGVELAEHVDVGSIIEACICTPM